MTYRIRIKPDWLKIDTFQAKRDEGRGAWAQPRHSAVRVTHQGYGIFAEASEGRSQFSNRAIAMERLELAIKDFLWPEGFHAPVNQAIQYINYTSIDTKARAHLVANWYHKRRMEQLRGMHDGTIGFTVDPAVFAYDIDVPGPEEPVQVLKLPSVDWDVAFPGGVHVLLQDTPAQHQEARLRDYQAASVKDAETRHKEDVHDKLLRKMFRLALETGHGLPHLAKGTRRAAVAELLKEYKERLADEQV